MFFHKLFKIFKKLLTKRFFIDIIKISNIKVRIWYKNILELKGSIIWKLN